MQDMLFLKTPAPTIPPILMNTLKILAFIIALIPLGLPALQAAPTNSSAITESPVISTSVSSNQKNEWADKCWPDDVGLISCFREFQTIWAGILAALAGITALVAGIAAYVGAKIQARATALTARTQLKIFLKQEKHKRDEATQKDEAEIRSVASAFLGEISSITSGSLLSLDEIFEERAKGKPLLMQRLKLRTKENFIFRTFASKLGLLPPVITHRIILFYGNHETMNQGYEEAERAGHLASRADEENITRWLNYKKALIVSGLNVMQALSHMLGDDDFEQSMNARHKELLKKHGISKTSSDPVHNPG